MKRIRAAVGAAIGSVLRLIGPEGAVMGGILLLGTTPGLFAHFRPLQTALLVLVAAAITGVAVRFRRGRLFHGMLVLAAAGAATALPAGDPATARTLAAVLVPLNLGLLALLPDRGITTRGGVLRAGAIAAQAGAVVLAARLHAVPDAALPLLDGRADTVLLAHGLVVLVLVTTVFARGDAPARGLLWAVVAALAAHLAAGGGPWPLALGPAWALMAGGVALLIAALEDAHSLAFHDALTGLPSRRALDEILERSVSDYTLAMVDIDHFKSFNDTHGHEVGDQVLRMVATRLRETGGGGQAFRYGGEEFTLLFRGRSLEQARPFLDRTLERVAASRFGIRGPDRPRKKPRKAAAGRAAGKPADRKRKTKRLSVTISIGAAERKDGSQSPAEVLAAADRALYRAKDAGRNRIHA